ncbi:MAG: response regulator transcription factor [Elusimicrobiota bacterium]
MTLAPQDPPAAASKTILIVEDDSHMRLLLRTTLAGAGHRVLEAEGVVAGLHLFHAHKPDLVILDRNLPDGDGVEACRKIRANQEGFDTPVIVLTGEGSLDKKASGFEAGVDQYLLKPIQTRELILWVGALLRRKGYESGEADLVRAGALSIDAKSYLVRFHDQTIPNLTSKEFELLHYLVKNRPQVISRQNVLSKLWHTVSVDNLVDVHLSNLRKKLPGELSDKIQTVPGKGFRFFEPA